MAAALLLALSGCAGPRRAAPNLPALPGGYPHHSLEEVVRLVGAGAGGVNSFSAAAVLSVDAPERGGRFTANIRARRNDSLYMSISPGLGIEVGRMLTTPDSIYVFDRVNNELLYGSVEDAAGLLAVPLAPELLFDGLLGLFSAEALSGLTLTAGDDQYILTDAERRRTYVVEPRIWRVIRYEERSAGGELVEERLYAAHEAFDGVLLPRSVTLNVPQQETRAEIYFRSLKLNPRDLTFNFKVNRSASRKEVGR